MQSGQSVLPIVGESLAGFKLNDRLVDDLANMEDEYDDGAVQPHVPANTQTTFRGLERHTELPPAMPSPAPSPIYLRDLELYAGIAFVFTVFALAAQVSVRWARAFTPPIVKASAVPEEPESSAAPAAKEADASASGGDLEGLQEAARAGDAAACAQLLKGRGRWLVRQEDPCGCTALHVAAHSGCAAVARLLLDHGAKVDAREVWEETPLHMAARAGSVAACELLVARRADLHAASSNGWTPLLAAAQAGQEEACAFLLSRGAGAGGAADCELPPLLATLLARSIIASDTVSSVSSD